MHREPPLDNQAPEKTRGERPNRPKCCPAWARFGISFVRKGGGIWGLYRKPLAMEKKLAASLADQSGFEPKVAV
jgi:hypothetical protein